MTDQRTLDFENYMLKKTVQDIKDGNFGDFERTIFTLKDVERLSTQDVSLSELHLYLQDFEDQTDSDEPVDCRRSERAVQNYKKQIMLQVLRFRGEDGQQG